MNPFLRGVRVCAVLLLVCAAQPAAARQAVDCYIQLKGFEWEEFDGGDRLLKESGVLFGIGAKLEPDLQKKFSFQVRAEAYTGNVNYDGQTLGGDPLNDTTGYEGLKGDADLVLPLPVAHTASHALALFGGVGGDMWQRQLATDTPEASYTEQWYLLDGRLGGGFYLTQTGAVRGFAVGGVRFPFLVENNVAVDDTVSSQDVSLKPNGQPGPFIEAGWRWGSYTAELFYEYLKFDTSDSQTIYVQTPGLSEPLPLDVFQPLSEMHVFGLNAGMKF